MSVLVFPAGTARGLEFVALNPDAMGASSLDDDPARVHYAKWIKLPYVTDSAFEAAFLNCIQREGIRRVFCPHPAVWSAVGHLLGRTHVAELIGPSPIQAEQAPYRLALRAARQLTSPLSEIEMAGLLKGTWRIEGEMSDSKIAALASVFPKLPKGDIVEIGSLYGKSAYVLSWLSRRFDNGNVLCIDPWDISQRRQHDQALTGRIADERDFSLIRQGFVMNMIGSGNVNYLPMFSDHARPAYKKGLVESELGRTPYIGGICLLHIDGNHDYDFVKQDAALWGPLVLPGGWIIFDDYDWKFGDGPRRAADEYVAASATEYFVAGGAMLVRVQSTIAST